MHPEHKLKELGLSLPATPAAPGGNFVRWKVVGDTVYLAGQGPHLEGKLKKAGRVGREVTKEEGYEAARDCCLNLLVHLKDACGGDLGRVEQIVKVLGFVSSAEDFFEQPAVVNGASDLLVQLFGDAGKHARSAIGVYALPRNIPVEVEMIAKLKDV